MKKALLTGITGQDGGYLAKLLLSKGYKVFGAQRHNTGKRYWRLDELGITQQIEFVDIDLSEPYNIEKVIDKVEPNEFYNLAAQSFVGLSFEQPQVTTITNSHNINSKILLCLYYLFKLYIILLVFSIYLLVLLKYLSISSRNKSTELEKLFKYAIKSFISSLLKSIFTISLSPQANILFIFLKL